MYSKRLIRLKERQQMLSNARRHIQQSIDLIDNAVKGSHVELRIDVDDLKSKIANLAAATCGMIEQQMMEIGYGK
ncbi:hypothetical protein ACLVWU_06735 [Bdellovibrio sp. HCB290]|uniref:hypothetical protein n=1 Tax=Bdellovibrio sp. HCB290 TaxID=3394356 RepID=UPI0039B4AAA0